MRNVGMFSDLIAERHAKANKIFSNIGDNAYELKKLNKFHAQAINERIAAHGLDSVTKRLGLLHHNQKIELLVGAVTVSALTLGVVLAASDHKRFLNDFSLSENAK